MVEDIGCGARRVHQPAIGTRCSVDMVVRSGTEEGDRRVLELMGCVLGHTGRAEQLSSRENIRQRSK